MSLLALAAGEIFVRCALVATRMGGFAAVSPFPPAGTPVQTRVGLVVLLTMVVAPGIEMKHQPSLGLELLGPVLGELGVGLAIGFVMRVALAAGEMLGSALAQAVGLSFAAVFDPTLAETKDPLSRIVTLASLVVAVAVGAHRVAIAYLLESFRAVPLGATPHVTTAAPALLAWTARSIEAGIVLGLPVVAVTLAIHFGLALVSRAAPSLQMFNVGIAVTLAAGFAVLTSGFGELTLGLATHWARTQDAFEALLSALRAT